MKHLSLIITIAAASTACGSQNVHVSKTAEMRGPSGIQRTEEPVVGSVVPGTFRLYKAPDTQPNPECDVHVRLQLINGFVSPVATLREPVPGACSTEPGANATVFNLAEKPLDCGTIRYLGGTFESGDAATLTGVEVIDNRNRRCRDRVAAPLIVNETFGDGHITTLYSSGAATDAVNPGVTPVLAAERGVLTSVAAIGGESTGTALTRDDDSVVEIDLKTHGFTALFSEGRAAALTGTVRKVAGIERPDRSVLVVESLTLL